jgi:hypothetical protein
MACMGTGWLLMKIKARFENPHTVRRVSWEETTSELCSVARFSISSVESWGSATGEWVQQDRSKGRRLWVWDSDGPGSGSYPVVSFGTNNVNCSGSAIRILGNEKEANRLWGWGVDERGSGSYPASVVAIVECVVSAFREFVVSGSRLLYTEMGEKLSGGRVHWRALVLVVLNLRVVLPKT